MWFMQHRELFKIGRDIEQLLLIQCIGVTENELMSILYELRDYITYHFYEEEAFMKNLHYPHAPNHIAQHKIFSTYINTLDYAALCASPHTELKRLKDELVNWIFEHLINEDKALEVYYNSHK